MSAAANFPLDLTELQVFRDLRFVLGSVPKTVYFFFLLFRDLAQLATAGSPLGRMTPANIHSFICLLVDLQIFEDAKLARSFLFEAGVTAKLFAVDGEDLVCPRFINLNASLVMRQDREAMGGRMKAFNGRQRKLEAEIKQMQLKVPGHIFVDATTGLELSTDETEAVQRLIMSCDNALMRDRPPIGWTEGLVTLALPMVRKLSLDQIEYTVRKIALLRDHPALAGMSTEKLLPQFDTIMGRVEVK